MFQAESIKTNRVTVTLETLGRVDRVYVFVFVIFMAIALLDREQLIPLSTLTLANLGHTSIYMAIAVLFLACIKATGAETIIASIFKGREHRMIFLAALIGGLAPFCSCEVIPFIAGLMALGTPLPPIMAFWLSSPLIDPPTLLITAGSLGWKFAVSKAFFAVAIGIFGGYAVKSIMALGYVVSPQKNLDEIRNQSCCSQKPCDSNSCSEEGGGTNHQSQVWLFWKEKARLNRFFGELKSNGLFLLKWMLFAYTLESLMIHYVPAHLIASVVGGEGMLPIILSALVGVPAYLNSYVAPPLVSGLMNQGMSVGSGMAFIIAGAISSIPAMTAVYALVRKQVFGMYVFLGFSGAVISGFVYSFIG